MPPRSDVRRRARGLVDDEPEEHAAPGPEPQPAADPTGPRVVLFGLPPVSERGLSALLTGHGMTCTVLPRPAGLAGLLTDVPAEGPLVLVLPATRWNEVPLHGDGPDDRLAAVHVVEAMSVAACAQALRAGAVGVIDAAGELEEMALVVRAAAAGQTVLPASVARTLALQTRQATLVLGERERTWLRELASGVTVSALARSAGYSERETYRLLGLLYARLGAANRLQALLLAERAGLLDDRPGDAVGG